MGARNDKDEVGRVTRLHHVKAERGLFHEGQDYHDHGRHIHGIVERIHHYDETHVMLTVAEHHEVEVHIMPMHHKPEHTSATKARAGQTVSTHAVAGR